MLNGEVGDYVTIARKDRNSDDWYLGSVTDENARTLEVKLDFLDAEPRYRAQIYRDGANADWRTHPHAIAIERREVRRGDTLQLKLAPGGGQAIRFQAPTVPEKRETEQCSNCCVLSFPVFFSRHRVQPRSRAAASEPVHFISGQVAP